MSQIQPLPGANVRSPSYFVARMSVRCPHCGITVAANGAAPGTGLMP